MWRRLTVLLWLFGCTPPTPPPPAAISIEVAPAPSPDDDAAAVRPTWTSHTLEVEAAVRAQLTLEEEARADDAYAEGQRAFAARRYAHALAQFVTAHEARPDAKGKWRVALCLDELGRYDDAVTAYRWFVASEPGEAFADWLADARARIALLNAQSQRLDR